MNQKSMIKIVGIILTIMWVSQVPYLFPHPFQERKGIRKLALEVMQAPDWIKQKSAVKDKTADELEKRMMTELRINWIKSTVFILIGVFSGLLLIQRRLEGYFLAFLFSLLFIGIKLANLLRYHTVTFSLKYYKLLLHHRPVGTIHDILMLLVQLSTVIFLMYIFVTRKKGDIIFRQKVDENLK